MKPRLNERMERIASQKQGTKEVRWYGSAYRQLPLGQFLALHAAVLLIVLAAVGPWIAPQPTEKADPTQRLVAPGLEHWFGTDTNGTDVFSRIVAAPRVDVTIALVATTLSIVIGVPLGVAVGLVEGGDRRRYSVLAQILMRGLDVLQAFPVFILALVLVAIRGPSTVNIIGAIAFVNAPVFLRLARSEVAGLRTRPFAEAARASGSRPMRIAFRQLLPNATPALMTQVSVTVGFAILLTAGLSFVGAGVPPPTPELGSMVSTGAPLVIIGKWWPSVFPGLFLGLTVFIFAVSGEAFGTLLAPRSGRSSRSPSVKTDALGPSSEHKAVSDNHVRKGSELGTAASTRDVPDAASSDSVLTIDRMSVALRNPNEDGDSPTVLLSDISLQTHPGQILGIVGRAGAGKSLLVKAVLGLLDSDNFRVDGRSLLGGENLIEMPREQLRVMRGVMIAPILPNAKAHLNPVIRIGEFMVAVVRAHSNVSRSVARERARQALLAVGIPEERLDAYPHELSGGMAQRVAIAIALLHEPSVLVADEPTSGLDVTVQRQILDTMRALVIETNSSMLLVTRDLGIVAHYCDVMAVMSEGRIVEVGPTKRVFAAPSNVYTAELLEAARGLPGLRLEDPVESP